MRTAWPWSCRPSLAWGTRGRVMRLGAPSPPSQDAVASVATSRASTAVPDVARSSNESPLQRLQQCASQNRPRCTDTLPRAYLLMAVKPPFVRRPAASVRKHAVSGAWLAAIWRCEAVAKKARRGPHARSKRSGQTTCLRKHGLCGWGPACCPCRACLSGLFCRAGGPALSHGPKRADLLGPGRPSELVGEKQASLSSQPCEVRAQLSAHA